MPFVEPRPARPLAIRITPLIDVVFILLVFFMLTTRLLPVDLLQVSTSSRSNAAAASDERIPKITLLPGQRLEWKGVTYSLDQLAHRLANQGIGRVNVITRPEASVQDFTMAMSTLNNRGVEPNWLRENGEGRQINEARAPR